MSGSANPSVLPSLIGQELTWLRPSLWRENSELHAADRVLATLRWEGLLRVRARAEFGEERWTIEPRGFLWAGVRVRAGDADEEVARFDRAWIGRGTLRFPDGREYRWRPLTFWGRTWGWSRDDSDPIVRLRIGFGVRRGRVDLDPSSASLPEMPLLLVVAWYLAVVSARRSAS